MKRFLQSALRMRENFRLCRITALFGTSGPINDAQSASVIGDRVAHGVFPNINYANYSAVVYDHYLSDTNRWVVSYEPFENNGKVFLGGGGPEIHLRKTDGQVLQVGIQR